MNMVMALITCTLTHAHFGDSKPLPRLNTPHGVLIILKIKYRFKLQVNLIFRFVCAGFNLGTKRELVSDFSDN